MSTVAEKQKIAKMIDQTNIRQDANEDDIKKTCQEVLSLGLRGLCVNPKWVGFVSRELAGSGAKTICLIDPPMGVSPHQLRMQECSKAKMDGADELDVVMNIVALKYERYLDVLGDLKEICQILPTKVIIGSGYLTDEEVRKAAELTKQAGAVCVKTATEKDPLGHSELAEKAKHLRIMRQAAPGLLIKAAGGIRTLADLQMMAEAGADIIGTSYGTEIIQEIS